MSSRAGPRALRLLLFAALPCVFWFGFFANRSLVPDTGEARTPVGFVHYDIYRLYYPSFHRYFGMLAEGRLPLWDPYRAVGFPAMGSFLFGVFYPLNFPFLLFAVPAALAVTSLLHFALAAWGTYRFLRGMALARSAALLGGIVYTFSGFMVFSLWHPSLFNVLATTPLLFAVGDRWARKGGLHRAVQLGLWIGLQGLAGYLQGTVYALYLLGPFLVLRVGRRWGARGLLRRFVPAGAGAGLLAAGLMAIVVVPASELSRRSIRRPGGLTLEQAQPVGPLDPTDYLVSVLDPLNPLPARSDPEISTGRYYFRGFPYFGVGSLLLGLLALGCSRQRRLTAFFAAAAVASAGLALGSNTFAFPLVHDLVPTGDWFRFPRRFLALTALSAAALVGLAVDGLPHPSRPARARLARTGLHLLPVTALMAGAAWKFRAAARLPGDHFWLALLLTAAAGAAALAVAGARGPRGRGLALALLGALLAADAFHRNRNAVLHPSDDPAPFSALQEGRRFLKAHAGLDRVYLQRFGGKVRNHLPAKIGLIDGYLTCMDYEALTLERYARYTNLLSRGTTELHLGFAGNRPILLSRWSYLNSRLFDYMSVKYVAVEAGSWREQELAHLPAKDGHGLLLRRAFTSRDMAIFENPHCVPRARFVPGFRVEPDPESALRALLDPHLDPSATVVLESAPPSGPGGRPPAAAAGTAPGAKVAIVHYGPHRVAIDATVPAAGFVVLTDQFYPGWKVAVNGKPGRVLRGDYLFRAVPVPAGHNRVVFRFEPRSFRVGAGVSALAGLACALIMGLGRRRARRAGRRP